MSLFFSSTIPSNDDMYARNAPELKYATLCPFLSEMDEEKDKIQTNKDDSEQLVERLQKERSQTYLRSIQALFWTNVFLYPLFLVFTDGQALTRRGALIVSSAISTDQEF